VWEKHTAERPCRATRGNRRDTTPNLNKAQRLVSIKVLLGGAISLFWSLGF
jgi:hypothetical protein